MAKRNWQASPGWSAYPSRPPDRQGRFVAGCRRRLSTSGALRDLSHRSAAPSSWSFRAGRAVSAMASRPCRRKRACSANVRVPACFRGFTLARCCPSHHGSGGAGLALTARSPSPLTSRCSALACWEAPATAALLRHLRHFGRHAWPLRAHAGGWYAVVAESLGAPGRSLRAEAAPVMHDGLLLVPLTANLPSLTDPACDGDAALALFPSSVLVAMRRFAVRRARSGMAVSLRTRRVSTTALTSRTRAGPFTVHLPPRRRPGERRKPFPISAIVAEFTDEAARIWPLRSRRYGSCSGWRTGLGSCIRASQLLSGADRRALRHPPRPVSPLKSPR